MDQEKTSMDTIQKTLGSGDGKSVVAKKAKLEPQGETDQIRNNQSEQPGECAQQ